MTRLIDADALISSVLKKAIDDAFLNGNTDMHRLLVQVIAHQPTIDAEPVRHGKWIWNDKCKRVCSVCENPVAFMLSKDGWHEGRYCPNCGARMDEE